MKIDLEKIFKDALLQIEFDVPFWSKMGSYIKMWIKKDMKIGKLQGEKETDYYRSQEYIRSKSNYMKDEKGRNLKGYEGVSIKSNFTNSVNMMLTGQLVEGLTITETKGNSVTVEYKSKDYHKLENNARFGRDVANLNKANRDKATKAITEEFRKNIKSIIKQNLTIKM